MDTDGMDEVGRLQDRIAWLERRNEALYAELTRRTESLPELLPGFYRPEEVPAFDGGAEEPVDILLTVRNSIDFLEPCLESIFANTDVPYRLILNDNASTDPKTPELLKKVRDERPEQVTLFLQDRDLGYPDAVNCMLDAARNDVILINADTVVPPGWASRLLWPIRHTDDKVGSCTPFSNSGPVIAFPRMDRDEELFGGMNTERIDAVFQTVRPEQRMAMPAGMGFCMAMSRESILAVGQMDADTFRPVYGEEWDWCLRAGVAGFKNILVPNLFVYHKHGGTYRRQLSAEREVLREAHFEILVQRYPWLENETHTFKDAPAYHALRNFLVVLSSAAAGGGIRVVFTGLEPEAARTRTDDSTLPMVTVSQQPETGEYFLHFRWREHACRFSSPDLNWVVKALYRLRTAEIEIEGLSPLADVAKTRRALGRLADHMNAKLIG